ncbi:L-2-hydroxyglutarate oxidase [Pirellulaceae bacterium]|jgi:L-2-hydroxyglutarate oxidase|nr:L-2-hydroxyglutarate oxidase [Pirellulaceae bacterium]
MIKADLAIVGGGIVGLAVGHRFSQRYPNKKIVVLEKEKQLAHHQTGHNSGVLHSGIYYKPGSLKAINCREGKVAMEQFCSEHGIDYDICGKVIVATSEEEIPRMEKIYQRGLDNGVACEIVPKERLNELEPYAAGIKAIHVPEAGIVNYKQVCEKLGELITQTGGDILTDSKVIGIEHEAAKSVVKSTNGEVEAKLVVNCAGLHCDRVTKLGGSKPSAKIIPFRGEYFELKEDRKGLCKNLIYPVPDPSFPFLGVHFTRMIEGGVECGPNAVLAFAREGYKKLDINLYDLFESLTYPGFIKMSIKHMGMGLGEMWRSFSKAAFVKALQKLMPDIRKDDLVAAPAGIRAQAVTRDGGMVDDFLIDETEHMVNVNNAPSPAATASLNIGKSVVEKLAKRFDS